MAVATTSAKDKDVTIEDLSKQIDTLRKDLSNLTGTIAGLGRTKAAELSGAARQTGAETADYLSARAQEMHDQTNKFVHEQPATALGIAAGAGFLIGFLTSRR